VSNSARFLLDEHVHKAVASELRKSGVDAITVAEAGHRGFSDVAHLEWAIGANRIIVTQDSDFVALHRAQAVHAGIVYFSERATIGRFVNELLLIYEVYSAEEMVGRLEFR